MTLLLQISDPHFGTEQPPVVEALVRLAQAQRPAHVILSGDITQRARRVQFSAARAFVDRLRPAPTAAIPGNHDIPLFNLAARLFRPYGNFSRAFGAELEPVIDSPQLLAIGVNTTRAHRHKNGEVSPAQVERVAQRLQGARPQQLRIVFVHQPIAVFRDSDEHDRLIGHDAATARWSHAGADLVLGGHIHLPYLLPLHETHPGGLPRRLWAVQAGTALSLRVREGVPNSVNLFRWAGKLPAGRCVVERWDFDATNSEFGLHGSTALDTSRSTAVPAAAEADAERAG